MMTVINVFTSHHSVGLSTRSMNHNTPTANCVCQCKNERHSKGSSAGANWTVNSSLCFRRHEEEKWIGKHTEQQSGWHKVITNIAENVLYAQRHPSRLCTIKLLPNDGEERASSVSDAERRKYERMKPKRRGVLLLLLLLLLPSVSSTLIEFGWIGDRWRGGPSIAQR